MWPLGQGMSVRVCSNDPVVPGDLVVFIAADGASVFAHRVVATTPDGLIARGDTNLQPDPTVPSDAVIGRVDAIACRGRTLRLPPHGPLAQAQRRLGSGWARVAPHLRLGWRRLRKV
mgnify:FL=1